MRTVNWVAEVDPDLRRKILRNGRIYAGWGSMRVEDYVVATRCFRCQRLGHLAARCTAEKETCRHCGGEGHKESCCLKTREPPVCVACRDQRLKCDHSYLRRDCPSYKRAIEAIIKNIEYGVQQ